LLDTPQPCTGVLNADFLSLSLLFFFPSFSSLVVVAHGLKAIEGAAGDKDLDEFNTGICYVGADQKLKMCTPEEIRNYINAAGISATSAPNSPVAASGVKVQDDDDVVMEDA
jgi:hypothetical protein